MTATIESGLRELVAQVVREELDRRAAAAPAAPPPSEFLTTRQAAEMLKMSPAGLEQWRTRGQGPAYVRAGRCVRYRRSAVEAWLNREPP